MAILFVVSVLKKLDGGEYEDAGMVLGESLNRHPDVLMTAFADDLIDKAAMRFAATSTPERYVDDIDGQRANLQERLAAIEAVQVSPLGGARGLSIAAIKSVLADDHP